MRVTWDSIKSFDIYHQEPVWYSKAILISNLTSGIFVSMITDIPLSISLFGFSITAFMGTTIVFLYSFILHDIKVNPKYK